MENQIKKSVKIGLIFLGIGVLLGSLVAFAATPSATFYISGGVYSGAPSYTVWREGSDYFAKDANGQIDYSGTNGTEVLTDAASNGGDLLIKNHTYLLDTRIILLTPIKITMEEGGILQATANMNDVIWILSDHVTLENVEIDGNNFALKTIDIWNSSFCKVIHCELYGSNDAGLSIAGAGDYASHNEILFNHVYDISGGTYGTGIACTYSGAGGLGGDNNKIVGNIIHDVAEHGIKVYERQNFTLVLNNHINQTAFTGISASGFGGTVTGNHINNTGTGGIYTDQNSNILINGNVIQNATTNGIDINFKNATVTGNTIHDCPTGIRMNLANYSLVNGNTITECTTGIYVVGNTQRCLFTSIMVQSSSFRAVSETSGDYNVYVGLIAGGSATPIMLSGANSKCHLSWNGTNWIA